MVDVQEIQLAEQVIWQVAQMLLLMGEFEAFLLL